MQRRITTYGLLTVACAALTTACGEDDNSRRMMLGMGGTTGAGNGGSSGNTTGTGGTGAQTGMGGGGNTAIPASCTGGCADMIVSFEANPALRQAQFLFRPGGTTVVDMTQGTVTWRVRLGTPASEIPPDQIYLAVMAQMGAPNYTGCYGAQFPLTAANGFVDNETWVNVVTNMRDAPIDPPPAAPPLPDDAGTDAGAADAGDAAAPVDPGGPITERPPTCGAGFDKTAVFQWGLYLGVTAAFAGPGVVRVGLDSVDYEGIDLMDVGFNENVEGFQFDTSYMPPPGGSLVHRP